MTFGKIHENILFKQNKCLEIYIYFKTQKRNLAGNDFEKDFNKLLENSFYGKTMETVRNRARLEFITKHEYEKLLKQQSEPNFINHMEIKFVI